MKKILAVLLAALLLASLCACASVSEPEAPAVEPETPSVETPEESPVEEAPSAGILSSFTAADLNGNPVDASILAGHKLTMVNVWATYCGPCLNEMPDLGELAAEYADQGVQIVGLVIDVLASDGTLDEGQIELAQEIVASTGANYTHLLPYESFYGILSQISAVPTTFFVDENGVQVGSALAGAMDKDGWAQLIDELLEEVE